jgi:hypothetical protein
MIGFEIPDHDVSDAEIAAILREASAPRRACHAMPTGRHAYDPRVRCTPGMMLGPSAKTIER